MHLGLPAPPHTPKPETPHPKTCFAPLSREEFERLGGRGRGSDNESGEVVEARAQVPLHCVEVFA